MSTFRVWIRPLRSNCRVRVDGIGNAEWLLGRLGRSFVFKTAEPMNEEDGSSHCSFHVEYPPRHLVARSRDYWPLFPR